MMQRKETMCTKLPKKKFRKKKDWIEHSNAKLENFTT